MPKVQKKLTMRSQVCRTSLIWRALENTALAHPTMGQTSKSDTLRPAWWLLKSRDGPGSRISAEYFACQDSRLRAIARLQRPPCMSASKCRILTFDPPLDVPESVLSSARQIRLVRHTCDLMVSFFWTLDKNCHYVTVWNATCVARWWFKSCLKALTNKKHNEKVTNIKITKNSFLRRRRTSGRISLSLK